MKSNVRICCMPPETPLTARQIAGGVERDVDAPLAVSERDSTQLPACGLAATAAIMASIRFAQPVTGAETPREAPASRIAAKDRAMQAPITSPHPGTPPEARRMPWGPSSPCPSSRFQDGVTSFRIVTSHKG